jgi:hypothetical protein
MLSKGRVRLVLLAGALCAFAACGQGSSSPTPPVSTQYPAVDPPFVYTPPVSLCPAPDGGVTACPATDSGLCPGPGGGVIACPPSDSLATLPDGGTVTVNGQGVSLTFSVGALPGDWLTITPGGMGGCPRLR